MSREQKLHVVLIVKLIAVLGFMAGVIICPVIHERDMAMVLMGGTMTGFSTLFVSSKAVEPQTSDDTRSHVCPRCDGPGPGPIIERKRHITKG
jgi:hypothetical protein